MPPAVEAFGLNYRTTREVFIYVLFFFNGNQKLTSTNYVPGEIPGIFLNL